MKITPKRLKMGMNLWPPFLGAGIRVRHIEDDWTAAVVEYRLNKITSNYLGVAFGGSLSAMTDAYFMLLTLNQLGNEYVVWDKAAEIDFIAPGRSHLTARMEVPAMTTSRLGRPATDSTPRRCPGRLLRFG